MALAGFGVLLDGSALRLWSLHRNHQALTETITRTRERTEQLKRRVREARQPEFIERAARDRFDLVKDGDLLFIFSGESADIGHPDSQD